MWFLSQIPWQRYHICVPFQVCISIWPWLTIVLPLQHKSFNFFVFSVFLCYNDFSQDKRLNFLVFLSLLRRTQRLELFCWVCQFFAWFGRKMIYGLFSLLSFYVFFFHLIYLTVADYCSSFTTQKLQFFCVLCLCFVL